MTYCLIINCYCYICTVCIPTEISPGAIISGIVNLVNVPPPAFFVMCPGLIHTQSSITFVSREKEEMKMVLENNK